MGSIVGRGERWSGNVGNGSGVGLEAAGGVMGIGESEWEARFLVLIAP